MKNAINEAVGNGLLKSPNKFKDATSALFEIAKTTSAYVDESALESLVSSGVITSYEIKRNSDGSHLILRFIVEPY